MTHGPEIARLLSVDEVAKTLGISKADIWRIIQRKEIPVVAIGGRRLFRSTDVATFVEQNVREAATSISADGVD